MLHQYTTELEISVHQIYKLASTSLFRALCFKPRIAFICVIEGIRFGADILNEDLG